MDARLIGGSAAISLDIYQWDQITCCSYGGAGRDRLHF